MLKNLTSGAVISYGPTFPSTSTAFAGALFYKNAGTDQGLYIFSFNQDADSGTFGDQVTQNWNAITTAGTFVAKAGDTMSGPLGITGGSATNDPYGRLSITLPTDGNSYGYLGLTRQGSVGWSIGIDTGNRLFFGGGAGALNNVTARVVTIAADGSILINGNTVWHSGNDGVGSGLDADLLDGQSSAFFTSATNISSGTLAEARLPFQPVQQGGGGGQLTSKVYIGWNGFGLNLQVDAVNFNSLWPISIDGNSATTTLAANSSAIGGTPAANVLSTSNYNTYAPTLTGTGASGTWNITVTNSAQLGGTAAALVTGATWLNSVNYTAGAIQKASNNLLYQALLDNGPSTSVQNPVSAPTYWTPIAAPAATTAEARALALNTRMITPARLGDVFTNGSAGSGEYMRLPGNQLMQTGNVTFGAGSDGADVNLTFPTAFAAGTICIMATARGVSGLIVGTISNTTTEAVFRISQRESAAYGAGSIDFWAFGPAP